MTSETIYALGDIHGQLDDLKRAHDWIASDRARNGVVGETVVHVGDLIDRGPDSAGVIDYLSSGQKAGQSWVVLKGNHDRFLQKFIQEPGWSDHRLRPDYTWLHPNMGGQATLGSYGVDAAAGRALADIEADAAKAVPAEHIDFIAHLPLYFTANGVAFVHAGMKPGIPVQEQAEDDLLWIRTPEFRTFTGDFGHLLVHGHTMVDQVTHFGNRIDIDTGAGRGDPISVIVIEGGEVSQLDHDRRRPVYHALGKSAV